MTTQDLGLYLMMWLISSLLFWLMGLGWKLETKTKILAPIAITLFVILMRISIFLMVGE